MSKDFIKLIGMFIHQCGALEFLTNNCIRAFSLDPLLSNEAIKSPFSRRIVLLRQLLYERSNIDKDDIDSISDELNKIREKRNIVAHNPIMSTKPDGSGEEEILVLSYRPVDVTIPDNLTKEDVAKLVNQTKELLIKMGKLIPESTKA